jgi:histidinol phosphatase-like PHP family hydrolase
MKVDTHAHLLLTKKSQPNWREIKLYFDVAKAQRIDVLTITEHIDALYFVELYKGLFIENKLQGKILDDGIVELPNSVIVVSGTEIPLKGGGEIGLHTKLSTILSLNKTHGYYTIDDIFAEVDNKSNGDYIMIGNHLYVPGKWIDRVEKKLSLLDAIEMLPKELQRQTKYESLAANLNKPLLSGSDSHVWSQLGLGYNEVTIAEYSIKNFKNAIRNNKVTMKLSPEAEILSEVSKVYREFLMSNIEA